MRKEKKYFNSLHHSTENVNAENEFDGNLPADTMFEKVDKLSASDTSRRDFLKFLGFSSVAATLASCEAPVVKSIPYLNKPEEITPGNATYYASSYFYENIFASILVKNREGRPILLSSNNLDNGGGVNARCQASVLSLYDSNRLTGPLANGSSSPWSLIDSEIINKLKQCSKKIVLLSSTIISPSTHKLLKDFKEKYVNFSLIQYDAISKSSMLLANKESFGEAFIPTYNFSKAEIIVSFSADFLGEWLDVSHARQYTANRKPENGKMSKHYQFESLLSTTGANADKRIPIKPSDECLYILRLYSDLLQMTGGKSIDTGTTNHDSMIKDIAKDLLLNKSKSLVVSNHNDTNVQVIINAINQLLSNYGHTIINNKRSYLFGALDSDINQLIIDINNDEVGAIMFADSNPIYSLSHNSDFIKGLDKVDLKISFSESMNETSLLCNYVCPNSNYLESWGDFQPYDELYTLQQPTISPLFNSRQMQDNLLLWMGKSEKYHTYLKNYCIDNVSKEWSKVLHDGYLSTPNMSSNTSFKSNTVAQAINMIDKDSHSGTELQLYIKPSIGYGLYANNPWLQELPDTISKVTWDNYLTISPEHAISLGLKNWHVSNGALDGDIVKISIGDKSIEAPIYIQPGQANNVLGLAFGYGRLKAGKVGSNVGVNAFEFYVNFKNTQIENVSIEKLTSRPPHEFACTQNSHTMMGRNIVKEATFSEYMNNPKAGNKQMLLASHKGKVKPSELSLWEEHEKDIHFWNMSIDLNSCTGCGACVIACHAENNVPVVGKEEVRKNRDMHWLRIDRYYSSDMTKKLAKDNDVGAIEMYKKMETPASSENLEVVFQPVMCQHCNNAPCETVCPVAATTHSREGLNHMTYNRCIGTRYCLNNCPYKVRRFNWFDYSDNKQFDYNMNDDLGKMVLNPDVTVRSRGVMEKCSMCIQNIQKSKLDAKKERRKIKDGEIQCACEKACDTGAIVFGDSLDTDSRVSQEKKNPRTYYLLEEINTKPSVFYKTKIRNKKV